MRLAEESDQADDARLMDRKLQPSIGERLRVGWELLTGTHRDPASAPWVASFYLASVLLSRLALVAVVAGGELVLTWVELRIPAWLHIDSTLQGSYVQYIIGVMAIVFDIAALGTVVVTAAFDLADAYRDRRREFIIERTDVDPC